MNCNEDHQCPCTYISIDVLYKILPNLVLVNTNNYIMYTYILYIQY